MAKPEIVERYDDSVEAGSVIVQSINAGEKVDEGTQLTLTISIGPAAFDMPNVVSQTIPLMLWYSLVHGRMICLVGIVLFLYKLEQELLQFQV